MIRKIIASGLAAILIGVTSALAGEMTVFVNKISADGIGTPIGTITLKKQPPRHDGNTEPERSAIWSPCVPYLRASESRCGHKRQQEGRQIHGG
jgi:hypothetical protein